MAEERVDRESGADESEARESFNEEGSVEVIFGNCPPYEPPSAGDAKDEAQEPRISHSDTEPSADKDSMCDREDDKDAEQEPEEIGEEAVRRSVPKGFTKSQGKTTTFSYPGQILLEDESSTPRRRISSIKASSKYFRGIQQFWPKFPRTHNAMSAATTGGRGSA